MKKPLMLFSCSVALVLGFGTGCENGGGNGSGVPHVAGHWVGSYYTQSLGGQSSWGEISLEADISFTSPSNIVIVTTKPGRAHEFYGTVDAGGHMRLIDRSDGELWTTYRAAASERYIQIDDFNTDEVFEGGTYVKEPESLATVELQR